MKIGIMTMYYRSQNYGGLLQAYALQKAIESLGYNAEQICYYPSYKRSIFFRIKLFCSQVKSILLNHQIYIDRGLIHNLKLRRQSMNLFSDKCIKHSDQVYDENNISLINCKYDNIIVGSDQVWNGSYPVFYLEFVADGIPKSSYAASISKNHLTEEQINVFSRVLDSYRKISVREKEAISLLKPYVSQKEIVQVLDPTLLLSTKEWDKLPYKHKVNENYLFCYFLGIDKRLREVARAFADNNNLKIVSFPFMTSKIAYDEADFYDYCFYDADPGDFVSMIRNAECVFTDSFHAALFSSLYKKNYFVFSRKGSEFMNSRIYSLVHIFGSEPSFCDDESKIDLHYLEKNKNTIYRDDEEYHRLKSFSYSFLTKICEQQ